MYAAGPVHRSLLGTLLATVVVASGCSLPPGEDIGADGGFVENATGETLFLYSPGEDGGLFRGLQIPPHEQVRMEGPCVGAPLIAKHSDDGPVIDSRQDELCTGDHWSIPQGGLVENHTSRTIRVRTKEPDSGTFYAINIGAGRTGSLRAPCADPPLTVGADTVSDFVPPRREPLCVGDVWVIEEP